MATRPIRVLVVEDSAFMRRVITGQLADVPDIEVVGSADSGEGGLAAATTLRPDVVTLDVEMPGMDGLETLARLMLDTPTRVVMVSNVTLAGAQSTLDALDLGAIDFLSKARAIAPAAKDGQGGSLADKIRAAARVSDSAFRTHCRQTRPAAERRLSGKAAASRTRPAAVPTRLGADKPSRRVVAIAASTGGPSALATLFADLPASLGVGIVVVQHLPVGFSRTLAQRLDRPAGLRAREARDGDIIADDVSLVAPGGAHLVISKPLRVELRHQPPVNGVRPAADLTLASAAPLLTSDLLAVVLTGMGTDGCEGARVVKEHGGRVYAQDEATSVIYGMPAAVARAGLADRVLPLDLLAQAIADWSSE